MERGSPRPVTTDEIGHPGTVKAGTVVCLGLTVFNADDPAAIGDVRVKGGLSFTGDNAVGHPRLWIEVLLGE